MNDSKIIKLLKTFSPEEIKQFTLFVHSPFYNRVKKVSALFGAVKKYYPAFESKKVSREKIYKKIYGKKTYNDDIMRNLQSDLWELACDFLFHVASSGNFFSRQAKILEQLKNRGLNNIVISHLVKTEKQLYNIPYVDEEYFFNSYLLQNARNNYTDHKNLDEFQGNINSEILQLSNFYLLHLFERYIQVDKFSVAYKTSLSGDFLNNIVNAFKDNNYFSSPIVKIYYYMFLLTRTKEDFYYIELMKLVKKNMASLGRNVKFNLYQALTGFYSEKERSLKHEYRRDRFNLFKTFIKDGSLLFNNSLSYTTYINALQAALLAGEYEWAEKFTYSHKDLLDVNNRSDAFHYNIAQLLHHKGKDKEALKHLQMTFPTNIVIKSAVKTFEMCLVFDLGYQDRVFNLIDNFRHFVTRDKVLADRTRSALSNFLKLYVMLTDIKYGKSRFSKSDLELELSRCGYMLSSGWIMDKIERLKE